MDMVLMKQTKFDDIFTFNKIKYRLYFMSIGGNVKMPIYKVYSKDDKFNFKIEPIVNNVGSYSIIRGGIAPIYSTEFEMKLLKKVNDLIIKHTK